MTSELQFARLLTAAIHRIRLIESKTVQIVQDELGYTLGREGGSMIEYWRKGHIPQRRADIEGLASELVRRAQLDRAWLEQFLHAMDYPAAGQLCDQLFGPPARQHGAPAAAPAEHPHASPARAAQSGAAQSRSTAPFIVGPPILHPRNFFGREREVKRIFDLWEQLPLQNVAVIGLKRSGKSSLLHYLRSISTTPEEELRPGQPRQRLAQPERYRWVFVDFQDARMRKRERLMRYILGQLELPVPEPCDLDSFLDVMSHEFQRPTIILMDQIGAAVASPELDQEFWWSLRSLGSHQTGGNLAFVLTAQQHPAELAELYRKPSPFFNIFGHSFTLGALLEAEAAQLLDSSPLPFATEDRAWILEQCGNWPCLLQILCHTRLAALREGDHGPGWRERGLRQMLPFRYLLGGDGA